MKKSFFDYYTKKLINDHLSYFILSVGLAFLFIFLIIYSLINNNLLKNNILNLKNEINNLKTNNLTVNYLISKYEINELINFLDKFLPNSDNYFSLIQSFNDLKKNSQVNIDNFSIKMDHFKKNIIPLKITLNASESALLDFFKTYNFYSGRLITIDKIDINLNNPNNTIVVNFHNKNLKSLNNGLSNSLSLDSDIIKKTKIILDTLKKKEIYTTTSEKEEEEITEEFEVNSNPFSE